MNEPLSRALIRAGLSAEDVAARLEVDPKTVCRWLEGRVPYRRYRWALAAMVGVGDLDLWPELRGQSIRPDDVSAVLPHRGDVSSDVWLDLLSSARREIGVLEGGGAFLPRIPRTAEILADRAAAGVRIRLCLPASSIAVSRSAATSGELSIYAPLRPYGTAEFRRHRQQVYNDLCIADERMLVGQHAFGVPAARLPLLVLERQDSDLFTVYLDAFECLWSISRTIG